MKRKPIRLLCLDFDGTIMTYEETPAAIHPAVVRALNAAAALGIAWCTNSGRTAEDQQDVLGRARDRGLVHLPAALLCGERLIFRRDREDYVAHEPWNTTVREQARRLHETVRRALAPVLPELRERFAPEFHWGDEYTAFLMADVEQRPQRCFERLRDVLAPLPDAVVLRNGGWVNILPRMAGKGNVLREYARAASYRPDEILAVGDHQNDLSMLDGGPARHCGCPADAYPEILATVRTAGGKVADIPGPGGTLQVMRHYLGLA